jgi:hypothetical protein
MPSPPLVVNLNRTLVKTDLVIEALVVLLKQNPLYFLLIPFWMGKGKGVVSCDHLTLPRQGRVTTPTSTRYGR